MIHFQKGLDSLFDQLPAKKSIFFGVTGYGKSTLIEILRCIFIEFKQTSKEKVHIESSRRGTTKIKTHRVQTGTLKMDLIDAPGTDDPNQANFSNDKILKKFKNDSECKNLDSFFLTFSAGENRMRPADINNIRDLLYVFKRPYREGFDPLAIWQKVIILITRCNEVKREFSGGGNIPAYNPIDYFGDDLEMIQFTDNNGNTMNVPNPDQIKEYNQIYKPDLLKAIRSTKQLLDERINYKIYDENEDGSFANVFISLVKQIYPIDEYPCLTDTFIRDRLAEILKNVVLAGYVKPARGSGLHDYRNCEALPIPHWQIPADFRNDPEVKQAILTNTKKQDWINDIINTFLGVASNRTIISFYNINTSRAATLEIEANQRRDQHININKRNTARINQAVGQEVRKANKEGNRFSRKVTVGIVSGLFFGATTFLGCFLGGVAIAATGGIAAGVFVAVGITAYALSIKKFLSKFIYTNVFFYTHCNCSGIIFCL